MQNRVFRPLMAACLFGVMAFTAPGWAGAQTCGNHLREAGEQCDDGNTTNLDGCSATCSFEQVQRVNYFKLQFATDTFCTANRFGGAIVSGVAQGAFQTSIDAAVADGSMSVVLQFLGLDDLSGTTDGSVQIGVMDATPRSPTGAYSGSSDLDWWYSPSATSIDASRVPLDSLPGSLAANVLDAGPGRLALGTTLGGQTVLSMSSVKIRTTTGTSSTPLAYDYAVGDSHGHLPAENLDPSLQSFVSMGQQTTSGAGKMCGNISAYSLAQTPVPATLQAGGSTACSQGYTAANSLLDVVVGGCTFFVPMIAATQPDQVDPDAPPAGAGGPYKLVQNAQHQVASCLDKDNGSAPLMACLNAAAYSSFFKFTTDRVIATDADPILYDTIFRNGFEGP